MDKYRKKPVEIEAIKFTQENVDNGLIPTEVIVYVTGPEYPPRGRILWAEVRTLEGNIYGHVGDWVIKGIKGEYYFCRADIFDITYDKVE